MEKVLYLKTTIEKILNDNKAIDVSSIDLKDKSSIADYMIVASGSSSRHIQSLSEILLTHLQKNGLTECKIEGKASKDWKLIDAMDIIVHIFNPEKRKFYDLEKMWSEPFSKESLTL